MGSDGKWSVSYIDDNGDTQSKSGLNAITVMNDLGLGTNQKILDFVKVKPKDKNTTSDVIPDMPTEEEAQVQLIMDSNPNLTKEQAKKLYNYQKELNK